MLIKMKDATHFETVASTALRHGRKKNSLTVEADYSGRCLNSQHVELQGKASKGDLGLTLNDKGVEITRTHQDPLYAVELEVKCRKCANCLKERQWLWTNRAKREVDTAHRTWFGTLTLSPHNHYLHQLRATQFRPDFDEIPAEDQLSLRHHSISKDLTKYLKRIRKMVNAPGALRYFLVMEPHKTMLPHYHLLVHETSILHPITKRKLDEQWKLGFSKWKLTDGSSAAYCAKYLGKTACARVRASVGYGSPRDPVARALPHSLEEKRR